MTPSISALSRAAIDTIPEEYRPRQRDLRMDMVRAWGQWDTLATRVKLFEIKRSAQLELGTEAHLTWDVFPAQDLFTRNRELVGVTCRRLTNALTADEYESLPIDLRMMLSQ